MDEDSSSEDEVFFGPVTDKERETRECKQLLWMSKSIFQSSEGNASIVLESPVKCDSGDSIAFSVDDSISSVSENKSSMHGGDFAVKKVFESHTCDVSAHTFNEDVCSIATVEEMEELKVLECYGTNTNSGSLILPVSSREVTPKFPNKCFNDGELFVNESNFAHRVSNQSNYSGSPGNEKCSIILENDNKSEKYSDSKCEYRIPECNCSSQDVIVGATVGSSTGMPHLFSCEKVHKQESGDHDGSDDLHDTHINGDHASEMWNHLYDYGTEETRRIYSNLRAKLNQHVNREPCWSPSISFNENYAKEAKLNSSSEHSEKRKIIGIAESRRVTIHDQDVKESVALLCLNGRADFSPNICCPQSSCTFEQYGVEDRQIKGLSHDFFMKIFLKCGSFYLSEKFLRPNQNFSNYQKLITFKSFMADSHCCIKSKMVEATECLEEGFVPVKFFIEWGKCHIPVFSHVRKDFIEYALNSALFNELIDVKQSPGCSQHMSISSVYDVKQLLGEVKLKYFYQKMLEFLLCNKYFCFPTKQDSDSHHFNIHINLNSKEMHHVPENVTFAECINDRETLQEIKADTIHGLNNSVKWVVNSHSSDMKKMTGHPVSLKTDNLFNITETSADRDSAKAVSKLCILNCSVAALPILSQKSNENDFCIDSANMCKNLSKSISPELGPVHIELVDILDGIPERSSGGSVESGSKLGEKGCCGSVDIERQFDVADTFIGSEDTSRLSIDTSEEEGTHCMVDIFPNQQSIGSKDFSVVTSSDADAQSIPTEADNKDGKGYHEVLCIQEGNDSSSFACDLYEAAAGPTTGLSCSLELDYENEKEENDPKAHPCAKNMTEPSSLGNDNVLTSIETSEKEEICEIKTCNEKCVGLYTEHKNSNLGEKECIHITRDAFWLMPEVTSDAVDSLQLPNVTVRKSPIKSNLSKKQNECTIEDIWNEELLYPGTLNLLDSPMQILNDEKIMNEREVKHVKKKLFPHEEQKSFSEEILSDSFLNSHDIEDGFSPAKYDLYPNCDKRMADSPLNLTSDFQSIGNDYKKFSPKCIQEPKTRTKETGSASSIQAASSTKKKGLQSDDKKFIRSSNLHAVAPVRGHIPVLKTPSSSAPKMPHQMGAQSCGKYQRNIKPMIKSPVSLSKLCVKEVNKENSPQILKDAQRCLKPKSGLKIPKTTASKKYADVQSPVSKSIRDSPPPPLIQIVKPTSKIPSVLNIHRKAQKCSYSETSKQFEPALLPAKFCSKNPHAKNLQPMDSSLHHGPGRTPSKNRPGFMLGNIKQPLVTKHNGPKNVITGHKYLVGEESFQGFQ